MASKDKEPQKEKDNRYINSLIAHVNSQTQRKLAAELRYPNSKPRFDPGLSGNLNKNDNVPSFVELGKTTKYYDNIAESPNFPADVVLKVHKPSHHKSTEVHYDECTPKIVYGYFKWDPQRASPTDYGTQADLWLRLTDAERHAISDVAKTQMFGPYLFQQPTVPNKWNKWAVKLNMLRANFDGNFVSFPNNSLKLPRKQYLACRLLELSFGFVYNTYSTQRLVLVRMLEMCDDITERSDLDSVLNLYGSQDIIKSIVDQVWAMIEAWLTVSDSNYLSVKKRRVFAILLSCRQLAEMIFVITCEGRDVVKELEKYSNRLDNFEGSRESMRNDANQAYKEKDFARAHSLYTVSISSYSPLDAHLYRNRSLCSIKTHKFEEAYQDGFRAVVLSNTWVKGYHVFTNALIQAKLFREAFVANMIARTACSKHDPDYKSLEEQRKIIKASDDVSDLVMRTVKPKDVGSALVSVSSDDSDTDSSDDDTLFSIFKKLHARGILHINGMTSNEKNTKQNAKKQEKEDALKKKQKQAEEKRRRELEKAKEEEQKRKKIEERKRKEEQKRLLKEEQLRKRAELAEQKRIKDEHRSRFKQTLTDAHKFYTEEKFVLAVRCYDSAIETFETITAQDLLLSEDDMSVIWYARGLSSVNQLIPIEINIATKFFEKIIKNHPRFHRIATAHFGLGFANYYMNNFETAMEHVTKSLSLLKAITAKVILTWPGTDYKMIECSYEYLYKQLSVLDKNCRNPPRPHARCVNQHCGKYYPRTHIYITDLHFDGYMIARCNLNCILCLHRKCWGRVKSDMGVGSDDQLIGEACWTSDCDGILTAIITVDEFGIQHIKHQLKKLLKRDKQQGQAKVKVRMSKSEWNMQKVLSRMNERKANRRQKQDHDRRVKETKIMEKLREMTEKQKQDTKLTEDTRSSGIPYKKNPTHESNKTNKHKKKGKPLGITLRELLSEVPGYHDNMTIEDIQTSIEEIKSMNEPFEISEKLFIEISEFETCIGWFPNDTYLTTDLQKIIALHVLRYFEDFFFTHGPMRHGDVLFVHQREVLTMDMQEVVFQRFQSLRHFLTSCTLFIFKDPYIGTSDQTDVIEKLCFNYHQARKRSQSKEMPQYSTTPGGSRTISLSDNGQPPADGSNALSAFAKDFYSLGSIKKADKFIPDEENDYTESIRFETRPMDHDEFETVVNDMHDRSKDNFYEDDEMYLVSLYDESVEKDKLLDGSDSVCSDSRHVSTETSSVASESVASSNHGGTSSNHSGISSNHGGTSSDHSGMSNDHSGTSSDHSGLSNDHSGMFSNHSGTSSDQGDIKAVYKNASTITDDVSVRAKIKTKVKQSQTTPNIRSIHTQTKGRDELVKSREAIKRLQDRTSELEDELTKSKRIYVMKEKKLSKETEELRIERSKMQTLMNERKNVKDGEKIANENKQLKERISKLVEANKKHESEISKSKSDLVKMEQLYAEARSKHLASKFELEETNQMLLNKLMAINERVKKSELVTLETQQRVALTNLHKAKIECQQISHEFDNKLKVFAARSADSSIITLINDARGKWTANIDECTKRIAMVQSQFAQQKEQINSGKPLEDLPSVPIPAPPPGGLTPRQLEAIITNKMQTIAANMNGFSGQMLRPQSSGSPVIQSKLPATKAAVQPPHTSNISASNGAPFNHVTSLTPQQQNVASEKLNRLIVMIQQEFNMLSRNTILAYINKVRTANNNTLSGLEYREILRRVKEIADRESSNFSWDRQSASFPSAHDEPESCVICYDPMTDKPVKTLSCKHKFHAECINQWLEKQKTCPNCRQFTPQERKGMKVSSSPSSVFPSFVFPPGLLDAATD